jgi:hypothetical protein
MPKKKGTAVDPIGGNAIKSRKELADERAAAEAKAKAAAAKEKK